VVAHTIADLRITGLAAGGDGVARHDGLAVFVPRTAVGDTVRASLAGRGRFARGTVREVLHPSPDRVDAPCVHYVHDDCGGCQWQHLDIAAQRAAKAQLVVDAMQRIAGIAVPRPGVVGDDRTFGYRRTISMTVRGHGGRRVGGFHAGSNPDSIVPIDRCLLAHADLQRAWESLRPLLPRLPEWRAPGAGTAARPGAGSSADASVARRGSARRDHRSSRPQPALRVSLRQLGDAEVAIVIEGGDRWSAPAARTIGEAVPGCRGIWWAPAAQEARLMWERDPVPTVHEADTVAASSASVHAPLAVAASFVQVNAAVAERLHACVLAHVLAESPARVIDGYAGIGRLTVALDAMGVAVVSIERDERACRHAEGQVSARARVLAGTVESRLAEALPADVIVLNPPRGGCEAVVCDRLTAATRAPEAPRALVYVSCDPATLARDVKRLAGWRVEAVSCFDLFPQTAHVETVCLLRPEAS
jgi:23S rRNA (uracil1939-C5)-methyltransferase